MAILNTALSPINRLLRRPVVEEITGKSRSTLYRDIKKGSFIKPVSIGGDRVAWPQNEIEAINQARIAGKSDEDIKQLVIELEAARGGTNPAQVNVPVNKVTPISSWDSGLAGVR